MAVTLTVTREVLTPVDDTYGVEFVITNAEGIDKNLFVVKVSTQGAAHDTYSRVASIEDLSLLQVGRVTSNTHYLSNTSTSKGLALAELKAVKENVPDLLKDLIDAYDAYRDVVSIIGEEPEALTITTVV